MTDPIAAAEAFDVLLWGVGHTHLHVLRQWAGSPIPMARLTCVSDFPTSAYSGMLTGVLAGQYPRERMEIDLLPLCRAAGVRLVVGEVTALDLAGRRLILRDHAPLPFDVLSIGIGSVPSQIGVAWASDVVPIKPMQTFLDRLDGRLRDVGSVLDGRPLRAAVVGAGAGGVEVAFCLPPRIRHVLGVVDLELTVIGSHDRVATGLQPNTAERVRREFESRGVRLRMGRRVIRAGNGAVVLEGGESLEAEASSSRRRARPLLRSWRLLACRPTKKASC